MLIFFHKYRFLFPQFPKNNRSKIYLLVFYKCKSNRIAIKLVWNIVRYFPKFLAYVMSLVSLYIQLKPRNYRKRPLAWNRLSHLRSMFQLYRCQSVKLFLYDRNTGINVNVLLANNYVYHSVKRYPRSTLNNSCDTLHKNT